MIPVATSLVCHVFIHLIAYYDRLVRKRNMLASLVCSFGGKKPVNILHPWVCEDTCLFPTAVHTGILLVNVPILPLRAKLYDVMTKFASFSRQVFDPLSALNHQFINNILCRWQLNALIPQELFIAN